MFQKNLIKSCLLILALAATAPYAISGDREFVGFSNHFAPLRQGILAMHRACSESFRGSKMCSSHDVMTNGASVSASNDLGIGFVVPSLVLSYKDSYGDPRFKDFSGVEVVDTDYFHCRQWQDINPNHTQNGAYGLALSIYKWHNQPTSSFLYWYWCDPSEVRVACCCSVGEQCQHIPGHGGDVVLPPVPEG